MDQALFDTWTTTDLKAELAKEQARSDTDHDRVRRIHDTLAYRDEFSCPTALSPNTWLDAETGKLIERDIDGPFDY